MFVISGAARRCPALTSAVITDGPRPANDRLALIPLPWRCLETSFCTMALNPLTCSLSTLLSTYDTSAPAFVPIVPSRVTVFVTREGAQRDNGRDYNYRDELRVHHGRLLLLWSGQKSRQRDAMVQPGARVFIRDRRHDPFTFVGYGTTDLGGLYIRYLFGSDALGFAGLSKASVRSTISLPAKEPCCMLSSCSILQAPGMSFCQWVPEPVTFREQR